MREFSEPECIARHVAIWRTCSMFGGGPYGDAHMPNWPHWHRTPLPGIATTGLRRDKGGSTLGQATCLPPFLLCYLSVRTVRLHSPFISGPIRISGLYGELVAGCLRSGPAWIVFCFCCWVADGKNGGGKWRGTALGDRWRRLWAAPAAPALSPSCGALSERQKRPPGPILLRFSA